MGGQEVNKVATVKIGPFYYSVEYIPDLRDESGKLDGRIRHSQTRIQIEADLNQQMTAQTLLHEILHAVVSQIAMPSLKEEVIDSLATGVYQVIRENPQLVKMINKK
jgi:hypothetical protein